MAPSMAELVAPVSVAEIELTEPATPTHVSIAMPTEGARTSRALVLVRLHGVPVGTIVVDAPAGTVDASSCAEAAWASLGTSLRSHLASDGWPSVSADVPQCQRDVPATDPPLISVVGATRERPQSLEVCLDSLSRMDYPNSLSSARDQILVPPRLMVMAHTDAQAVAAWLAGFRLPVTSWSYRASALAWRLYRRARAMRSGADALVPADARKM